MKIRFNQPETKNPEQDRGLRVQYSESKRSSKSWRWYLIVLIASMPLLYLLGLIAWDEITIEANGRIRVSNFVVRTPVDGYIQQIHVRPLQSVAQGEPLAQLVNASLQEQYDRMYLEIASLEKEQKQLHAQAKHSRSASLQLQKAMQDQKNFLFNRLRQYEKLFEQGAATQAEIATIRSQYYAALQNEATLQKTYGAIKENAVTLRTNANNGRNLVAEEYNSTPEMIQVNNHLNQRNVEFEKVRGQIDQLKFVAPAAGTVTEISAQPGEYLGKGQVLMEVIYPDTVFIDAFIPPKYQNYAVVGQVALVRFANGEEARAKITAVPGVIQKSSLEASPLEVSRSAILAHMQFIGTVNNRLMNGMPVDIYFRGITGEYQ